jgi:hypothetical protein
MTERRGPKGVDTSSDPDLVVNPSTDAKEEELTSGLLRWNGACAIFLGLLLIIFFLGSAPGKAPVFWRWLSSPVLLRSLIVRFSNDVRSFRRHGTNFVGMENSLIFTSNRRFWSAILDHRRADHVDCPGADAALLRPYAGSRSRSP